MESTYTLLVSGTLLLAISALLGFVQERYRDSPEAFGRWRVVHAGERPAPCSFSRSRQSGSDSAPATGTRRWRGA